jgi:acyl dehydratase
MNERYLDDFTVGFKFTTTGATLHESQIMDFALTYDPQPFHIDAEAARSTNYGSIIASGFQTLALGFRLIWDTGLFRASSMGSPGFDEIRWLKPVRPGDTLSVEGEVVENRPSTSKPDRGIARISYRYRNQKGEVVLTFLAMHLLRRRAA